MISDIRGWRAAAASALALVAMPLHAQAQAPAPAAPPAPAPTPAPPAYGTPLPLDEALAMIRAGMAIARAEGFLLTFAIVEPSGELIAFARMENAIYGSIPLAEAKARNAARFRSPTALREQALTNGRLQLLSMDEVVALAGGVPVVRDGKVVGAIGVSGASSEQDARVATAMANLGQR
jgi:uncharacterized protein GlcG (DUF336 family)